MAFEEILAQVLHLLQREGRVSYRALKLRFNLDDDYLEALKDEIIEAKQQAVDENGKVLVWTGGAGTTSTAEPVLRSRPTQRCRWYPHQAPRPLLRRSAASSLCCFAT